MVLWVKWERYIQPDGHKTRSVLRPVACASGRVTHNARLRQTTGETVKPQQVRDITVASSAWGLVCLGRCPCPADSRKTARGGLVGTCLVVTYVRAAHTSVRKVCIEAPTTRNSSATLALSQKPKTVSSSGCGLLVFSNFLTCRVPRTAWRYLSDDACFGLGRGESHTCRCMFPIWSAQPYVTHASEQRAQLTFLPVPFPSLDRAEKKRACPTFLVPDLQDSWATSATLPERGVYLTLAPFPGSPVWILLPVCRRVGFPGRNLSA
ncbi:hypothetical protein IF2G_02800 [Cordyceps javanica]|nr:hypothetical protein IF2G_02800 [Cordyceps javanica]